MTTMAPNLNTHLCARLATASGCQDCPHSQLALSTDTTNSNQSVLPQKRADSRATCIRRCHRLTLPGSVLARVRERAQKQTSYCSSSSPCTPGKQSNCRCKKRVSQVCKRTNRKSRRAAGLVESTRDASPRREPENQLG